MNGCDTGAPDKTIRYQNPSWNKSRLDLTNYSHQWYTSQFTGAKFQDWIQEEVACAI
jgi:hypothetical protein